MLIDISSGEIFTLILGYQLFSASSVLPATMARWIQSGVRGVKRVTFVIGGRRFTRRQAVARIIEVPKH